MGYSPILSLCTRARDRGLLTRTPRDEIASKEDAITGGGASIIRAASPVTIKKGMELRGGLPTKEKTMGDSVLEIAKNSLDSAPMWNNGAMHELAHFVKSKRDIWPSERKVLKRANNTTVHAWIRKCLTSEL
jgi:hypothetical protein